MIRINLKPEPVSYVKSLTQRIGGSLALTSVNVYFGTFELPVEVHFDALVFTSDLQSLVLKDPLNGETVTELFPSLTLAEFLQLEEVGLIKSIPVGLVIPEIIANLLRNKGISPQRVLVLLCGDLTGDPDRGSNIEVNRVWTAFESVFKNVVGVLGNHDLLDANTSFQILDGDVISFGKLKIAGVSGIIGKPSKPNRKPQQTYQNFLLQVLKRRPHVLLLHESPRIPGSSLRGNIEIARWLQQSSVGTLICTGHVRWESIVASLPPHLIMNVEHRVIILRKQNS